MAREARGMGKRTLAIFILMGQVALAAPAGKRVALVKEVQGSVQSGAEAVKARARLAAGSSLRLTGSSSLLLHFYADGHREELHGPCFVQLEANGCRVLQGGPQSLALVDTGRRTLVLPQHGNIQQAGGQVAPGVAQTSRRSSRPAAESASAAPAPARAIILRDAEALPVEIDFKDGLPRFESTVHDGGVVILQDEHQSELARWNEVPREMPEVQAGGSYRLLASNGAVLPFRVLDAQEQARFARLKSRPGDPLEAAATYASLGLPHLEAAQLERALAARPRDIGLLSELHRLYVKQLGRPNRAKELELQAAGAGYQL